MITTTSGFPRHVCGVRVFYMFSYGREKEISLFAQSDVIGWVRGEALYPTFPEYFSFTLPSLSKNEVPFDEKFRFFL